MLAPMPDQGKEIYLSYFEPYPNVIAPVVREGQKPDSLNSKPFLYYDQGDYKAAAKAFGLLFNESNESYALLYQGISLLALGKTNDAISLLEGIDWTFEPSFTAIAYWYLALAYLETGQVPKAKSYLTFVADSDHYLSIQAKQIIQELS